MSDGFEIATLGDLVVSRRGQPVDLPASRKTRALLAYLAVTARRHQRERLCEIFWEVPDDPRGSLRWSLSKIRAAVGEHAMLLADRNGVELKAGLACDHPRFVRIAGSDLQARSTDELEQAAALWRGGFLADLTLDRCPSFESWRTAMADELAVLRARLLRALVDRLRAEPARARPYAQALSEQAPDDAALAAEAEQLAAAARVEVSRPAGATVATEPAPQAKPPATRASQGEVRFCKAADGTRLAYSVVGEGPPVVRAAHWMSHLRYDWESPIWRHWLAALTGRYRLLRYDERCNGLSDWDATDISFDTMVSDLETVIEAAAPERFTLLGISQGCALSVAYAARHPERVSGLVLYGGYVRGWRKRGNPREIATREALATLMREGWGQNNPLFRQLFTSQFIRGAGPQHVEWIDELQRRTVSPENAWRLQHMFGDIDVAALLGEVAVPTLVVHARDDAVAPLESGRTFAAEIAGARFVELDSSNHILLDDEPAFADFLAAIDAFIAETAEAPASA